MATTTAEEAREAAVDALVSIAEDDEADDIIRIQAATAILDRLDRLAAPAGC